MSKTGLQRFAPTLFALVFMSLCCNTDFVGQYAERFSEALNKPAAAEAGQPESQQGAEAPQQEQALQSQGPFTEFSLANCSCGGIDLPLNEERSSASNNTYRMGMLSGGEVEVTNRLTCVWEQPYQSENKTATITFYMDMYRFAEPQYAQSAYTEYSNDIKDDPGWCEEDESCTVTAAEYGDRRSFYAEETFYQRGDGTILPSTHRASVVRLFEPQDGYFVMDFFVTHPELELGDPWVRDKAQSLEACMQALVGQ